MTIIAGFYCANGLLLCSYTEQSYAESKSQVRKVSHFRQGSTVIAIGGAGHGPEADFVMQDLPKLLDLKASGLSDAEDALKQYAQRIFKDHVQVYAGFPRDEIPSVAFLVGMVIVGRRRLFKWERNFLNSFI